jgi:hypothetical protein
MSDTTALAIRAALDGRQDVIGRRTMTAVTQLLRSLTTLREQPSDDPDQYGRDVFKNEDITSGVGRFIGEEGPDKHGIPRREVLELSRAIAVDAAGKLVINDVETASALADTLQDWATSLSKMSASTYAKSRNSSSE